MHVLLLFALLSSRATSHQEPVLKTENEDSPADCITTLLGIQRAPLHTTNCCLTKLCPCKNSGVLKQMMHDHLVLPELLDKLCSEELSGESSDGCILQNNLNSGVNKDTNNAANKGKSAIANCSANFRTPTINGGTALINSGITGDSKKRSPEKSGSETFARDEKIRFENITKISTRISGLQFLDVPKGDGMRLHNLRLEEEYLLFEVFTGLMGYLQVNDFPADLVRNALHNPLPIHLVAFQLLKMEVGVLGWLIFSTILTLCIPSIALVYFCCSKDNIQRLTEDTSDDSLDFRDKCVERTSVFLLVFLLLLQIFPLVLIFIGNEQISRQMSKSPTTTNIIFDDLDTFVRNAHMQMTFVATSSTDLVIEAIRRDLEDVDELVGRPFQEELAYETGIDSALEALDQVDSGSGEVTSLVIRLLDECGAASEAGRMLQARLKELSTQLTIARQQCRPKDRALCYTLQYTGLDVVFSCGNLTSDLKIQQLELMGKEKKLSSYVENARAAFRELPARVSRETASHVAEIKNVLARRRTEVYKSAHALDELSRALSAAIRRGRRAVLPPVQALNRWDLWRWLSVLGISTTVSLVWGVLLCGAPCGCEPTSRTTPVLLSGVVLASIVCVPLWSLGAVSFLLGAHGQSLLCQPLYDEPHYKALAEILDSGGILYKEGGALKDLLKGNDSLRVEDVLESCQRNRPVYSTFHLHNFFDTSVTNYKTWTDYKTALDNFSFAEDVLEILSPSLQLHLQALATLSAVDFTPHRSRISGVLTRKDLTSFAEQLNTVARQLSDPSSSKKFDDLAAALRRIIQKEAARLSDLRDSILYKLTALEVFIHPLSRQSNRSLSHLKDVQFFLDNRRGWIVEKSRAQFVSRLEGHLEGLRNYTVGKITKEIGKCGPLWEIFHSARFSVCKLVVDPSNGIAVASFALILLFLGIVPVVLNLVDHYRGLNEELLTSITHRRTRDGLIIDDEGTWATPSSETPPDADSRNNGHNEPSTWITPNSRQSSEPLIPPPPRVSQPRLRSPKRLSTIASRISAARVPQIPSVSRARSPKRGRHESLRLVEPICWKSGSLSPKSWL